MTETPTPVLVDEELTRLARERDAAKIVRDKVLDRDSDEWRALDGKYRVAIRDWERVYARLAKRRQREREAEQAALAQEEDFNWEPETPEERERRKLAETEKQRRNRLALSPDERAKLDERVADFDRYHRLHKAFTDASWKMQWYDEQPGPNVPTPAMMNEAARGLQTKYISQVRQTDPYFYLKTYGVMADECLIPTPNYCWPKPRPAPPAPITTRRPVPAPPVSNAQAAAHQERTEVQTELVLTPLERHMRDMPCPPGVPESWWRK